MTHRWSSAWASPEEPSLRCCASSWSCKACACCCSSSICSSACCLAVLAADCCWDAASRRACTCNPVLVACQMVAWQHEPEMACAPGPAHVCHGASSAGCSDTVHAGRTRSQHNNAADTLQDPGVCLATSHRVGSLQHLQVRQVWGRGTAGGLSILRRLQLLRPVRSRGLVLGFGTAQLG